MKKLPLDGDTFIQMISSLLEGWSCIICEGEVSLVVIAYILQKRAWTVDSGHGFLEACSRFIFYKGKSIKDCHRELLSNTIISSLLVVIQSEVEEECSLV
jgi:hypothetical protein